MYFVEVLIHSSLCVCLDNDMAGRHRSRNKSIQIIKTATVAAKDCKRTSTIQMHVSNLTKQLLRWCYEVYVGVTGHASLHVTSHPHRALSGFFITEQQAALPPAPPHHAPQQQAGAHPVLRQQTHHPLPVSVPPRELIIGKRSQVVSAECTVGSCRDSLPFRVVAFFVYFFGRSTSQWWGLACAIVCGARAVSVGDVFLGSV
jgi:hypothetical protein